MVTTGVPAPVMRDAHLVEHRSQVDDLGLASRVVDHGLALCAHRGHNEVLGGADARKLERDRRTHQALGGIGVDISMVGIERHAQGFEAQDMHIDLARTEVAAARHRDSSPYRNGPATGP